MSVKIISASSMQFMCVNCGNPRAKHSHEKQDNGYLSEHCPLKAGGYSKKSQYANPDDTQWKIDQCMNNEHRFHRFVDNPMDPPTFTWKVGDKVLYGNHDDSRVEAVSEDGLRIVVSSAPEQKEDYQLRRGEKQGTKRTYHGLWWWDVSQPKVEAFLQDDHTLHFTQTQFGGLVDKVIEKRYDDAPDYQRDYVWTPQDKVSFMESAFAGRDIGKFVFVDYRWPRNRQEIVDGKQRLTTAAEYFRSMFPVHGYYYRDLGRLDRARLASRTAQVAEIDGDRATKAEILSHFLNINAAGVPQTEAHLAKARALYEKALKEGK